MGSGLVKPADADDFAAKRALNRKLEADLVKESRQEEEKIKLLLLGAGESGKSTVFKQMKIIYGTQFSEQERRVQISTIQGNIIAGIRILAQQASARGLADKLSPEAQKSVDGLAKLDDASPFVPSVAEMLSTIWSDPIIQTLWEVRADFQVNESLKYYMQRIGTVCQSDYLPTQEDILHNRVRTSGIVTERYLIDNALFEMYDVGGQRNERKKWIHCFENVTAVIFVVGLSEFDQVLYEDEKTNRMEEALVLFDDICNNPFFETSSMILFFNKRDLFAEKIRTKSLKSEGLFSDYTGGDHDYAESIQYLVNRFLALNRNQNGRQLYYHVTCATDTTNIQVVFNACKDIVLRENMKASRMRME